MQVIQQEQNTPAATPARRRAPMIERTTDAPVDWYIQGKALLKLFDV
jgi:hypothetical protein